MPGFLSTHQFNTTVFMRIGLKRLFKFSSLIQYRLIGLNIPTSESRPSVGAF